MNIKDPFTTFHMWNTGFYTKGQDLDGSKFIKLYTPEVSFRELFHVESFVCEWRDVKVTLCWEHFTVGFQPLLCMKIALQHPLIKQHVAHRLRNNYVHLLKYTMYKYEHAIIIVTAKTHICLECINFTDT